MMVIRALLVALACLGSLAAIAATSTTPRLVNIATRMQVLTGDNVMIVGFVIGGTSPKSVVVRARGPTLAAQGVPNPLANPTLALYSGQTMIASNDDWASATNATEIQASGFAPQDPVESAILTTLSPGGYTAIVAGAGGVTGTGIVEVFEVDHPEIALINIATRGQVLTGDQVMIGGFVIQGDGPQTVVVRARGPSLAALGVSGALADPMLQLYAGQTLLASNDNWRDATNAAQINSSGFAPSDLLESAIHITLNPGAYTAIVTGAGNATGVGLVEIFAVKDTATGSFAFAAAKAIGAPNADAPVSIQRSGGSFGAYDLYYSLVGSGCARSETVGPVRFADGDAAPKIVNIPLAGSGVCSAILVTPSAMIGLQRTVEVTVVPVVAGCPTPQADILFATLGGLGNPLLQRQRSGQVVFLNLPATSPGRSSGQVTFGESASAATPQPVTLEITISKCPGVIDNNYGSFCNLRSTNGSYNSIVWLSKESGGLNSGNANSRGLCWAGEPQNYYINARWTYTSCPFGAETCGFAIQYNDGPY